MSEHDCHEQYREASRQLATARELSARLEAQWYQAKADESAAGERVSVTRRALAEAREATRHG